MSSAISQRPFSLVQRTMYFPLSVAGIGGACGPRFECGCPRPRFEHERAVGEHRVGVELDLPGPDLEHLTELAPDRLTATR